jgi:predicted permease
VRHLRGLFSKLRTLFTNARVEEELEREIVSHLALIEDDFRQRGMSQEQARLAARRVYGGVEQAKQLHRDERSILWFERIRQNLRYALRQLRKSPGFAITVLLTLALGIGANTAIYTVVYATLLAPLPYPDPNQLVSVFSKGHGSISAQDYIDWKQHSSVFQDLNAWTAGSAHSFNIATQDEPAYISGMTVTPGYFQMLGSHFYLGRDFLPEEGQTGKDRVVILTHGLWKRLGANPSILGMVMRMNDEGYTVVGVLAPGPADHGPGQVIVPLAFKPEQLNYKFAWVLVRGRLKSGISLHQAQANMDAVTASIGKIHPERRDWGALVVPLKNDFVTSDQKLTLWLLMGAVGFILLIACMNTTNLLLAKGTSRQKEMAVRGSLGATRRIIFSQLLTEGLLLAILGGILGLGTGFVLLRGLVAMMPPGTIAAGADLHLNLNVLFYILAATSLAGLIFGCAPAWYASRIDPAETLKDGGSSGTGAGRHRLRKALVVGEFAIALTLLAGAGRTIHSFWNLTHVDVGISADHVLTFHLQVPDSRPKDPERIVAYYHRVLDRIRSVPGASHAAATDGTPLNYDNWILPFSIAGRPGFADATQRPVANVQVVTPDYFQTFGIHLAKGRMITDPDCKRGLGTGRGRISARSSWSFPCKLYDAEPALWRRNCGRSYVRRGGIHSSNCSVTRMLRACTSCSVCPSYASTKDRVSAVLSITMEQHLQASAIFRLSIASSISAVLL